MAFLVCLLFRESIGVAITKSFVIFVRNFFVSSTYRLLHSIRSLSCLETFRMHQEHMMTKNNDVIMRSWMHL